ncbi:peptidase M23 [Endozoicomonas sp. (ex Bugula neritina AB1)]|nr:peptidase M23 [Endozoicomonas sp. (ex Bugula neritina AB1)]
MVGKDGLFVLGFGRDAQLTQSYRILDDHGQEKQVLLTLKPREYNIENITGVAHKYVTPPAMILARIRKEAVEVRQARTGETYQRDFFRGFDWPVTGRISGVYGSQRIYNGHPGRPHYGLDIAVPTGTPVEAPANGVVKLAGGELYYSGGTIIIDHGFGLFSSFLHLSKVAVKEGQKINRGQIIGKVGATGRVTGPHLDWRYNWFDKRLDPQLLTLSRE